MLEVRDPRHPAHGWLQVGQPGEAGRGYRAIEHEARTDHVMVRAGQVERRGAVGEVAELERLPRVEQRAASLDEQLHRQPGRGRVAQVGVREM